MDGRLNDFLGQFKKILFSADDQKESILRVLKKVTNLELSKEQVEIKKNTIHFKISQTLKSHLFIKKDEILTELKKENIPVNTILW